MSLREEFIRICNENQFNGNVLYAEGNDIVFEDGFGYADIENGIPFTNDVVFRIGSVTKQITAVAVLQLAERGLLKLTDTIDQYVMNIPYDVPITIHHLLSNSSGIPNFDIHEDFTELLESDQFLKRLIQEVILLQPLHFTPGERFEYSSSGFIILSYIIEKISKRSYIDYIQQNIFNPLQMNHSGFHFMDIEVPQFSCLYDLVDGQIVESEPYNMRIASGAGGLYSTIEDIYKWGRGLIECTILSKHYRDRMFAVQTPINESGGYGYGVISIQFKKGENTHFAVYHPGNGPGVFAQNWITDTYSQLILLSNINDGKTFRKTFDELTTYLEETRL